MAKYFVSVPMINPMADPHGPVEEAIAWVTIYEHNDPDQLLIRATELAQVHFPYRLSTYKDITPTESRYFQSAANRMATEAELKYQAVKTTMQAVKSGIIQDA
jgi:hypothetical protein